MTRKYAEDIAIAIVALAAACLSVSYFFGYLQQEKLTERKDIFCLLPSTSDTVLAVNQPGVFDRLVLDKDKGLRLFKAYLPEIFLQIIREQPELKFALFSFHPEGVACYLQADRRLSRKIEQETLQHHFTTFDPQTEYLYGQECRFYPDQGSRFLGCYQKDGVWIASYSKRLLETIARQQAMFPGNLPDIQTDLKRFDPKATANLLFPAGDWQIQVTSRDSVIWKYPLPRICVDLFPSEGNLCTFCSLPYPVPADSLFQRIGDSLAIQVGKRFPALQLTPQISHDDSQLFFTCCTPL